MEFRITSGDEATSLWEDLLHLLSDSSLNTSKDEVIWKTGN